MVLDGLSPVCTLWILATTFVILLFVSTPTTTSTRKEVVGLTRTTSYTYDNTRLRYNISKFDVNKRTSRNDFRNSGVFEPPLELSNRPKVQYRLRRGIKSILEESMIVDSITEEDHSINNEDYYTYDYYADAVGQENMPPRNKRSSAALLDESNSEFLLKLAEMVGNFDSKYIPNFTTPNPNIEITIEVLNDVNNDVEDYKTNSNNGKGSVGTWSDWTTCSVTCGDGLRQRTRSCDSTPCVTSETQECDLEPCAESSSMEYSGISVASTVELEKDGCEEWMMCKDQLAPYFEGLPSCPCSYPTAIFDNVAILDDESGNLFNWEDASRSEDHLEIFKPTAKHCIRSLHSEHTTSSASQQCCYNDNLKLITRGPGAGTPQLISTKISKELHYKIDVLPWIVCKGDWTKYNEVRPPNNMAGCREFPNNADLLRYIEEASDF